MRGYFRCEQSSELGSTILLGFCLTGDDNELSIYLHVYVLVIIILRLHYRSLGECGILNWRLKRISFKYQLNEMDVDILFFS